MEHMKLYIQIECVMSLSTYISTVFISVCCNIKTTHSYIITIFNCLLPLQACALLTVHAVITLMG